MNAGDSFGNICRLCLGLNVADVPVFLTEQSDEIPLIEKIGVCLPISISIDDALPKNICDDCYKAVDFIYGFRQISLDSEKRLENTLKELEESAQQVNGHFVDVDNTITLYGSTLDNDNLQLLDDPLDEGVFLVPSDGLNALLTENSTGSMPPVTSDFLNPPNDVINIEDETADAIGTAVADVAEDPRNSNEEMIRFRILDIDMPGFLLVQFSRNSNLNASENDGYIILPHPSHEDNSTIDSVVEKLAMELDDLSRLDWLRYLDPGNVDFTSNKTENVNIKNLLSANNIQKNVSVSTQTETITSEFDLDNAVGESAQSNNEIVRYSYHWRATKRKNIFPMLNEDEASFDVENIINTDKSSTCLNMDRKSFKFQNEAKQFKHNSRIKNSLSFDINDLIGIIDEANGNKLHQDDELGNVETPNRVLTYDIGGEMVNQEVESISNHSSGNEIMSFYDIDQLLDTDVGSTSSKNKPPVCENFGTDENDGNVLQVDPQSSEYDNNSRTGMFVENAEFIYDLDVVENDIVESETTELNARLDSEVENGFVYLIENDYSSSDSEAVNVNKFDCQISAHDAKIECTSVCRFNNEFSNVNLNSENDQAITSSQRKDKILFESDTSVPEVEVNKELYSHSMSQSTGKCSSSNHSGLNELNKRYSPDEEYILEIYKNQTAVEKRKKVNDLIENQNSSQIPPQLDQDSGVKDFDDIQNQYDCEIVSNLSESDELKITPNSPKNDQFIVEILNQDEVLKCRSKTIGPLIDGKLSQTYNNISSGTPDGITDVKLMNIDEKSVCIETDSIVTNSGIGILDTCRKKFNDEPDKSTTVPHNVIEIIVGTDENKIYLYPKDAKIKTNNIPSADLNIPVKNNIRNSKSEVLSDDEPKRETSSTVVDVTHKRKADDKSKVKRLKKQKKQTTAKLISWYYSSSELTDISNKSRDIAKSFFEDLGPRYNGNSIEFLSDIYMKLQELVTKSEPRECEHCEQQCTDMLMYVVHVYEAHKILRCLLCDNSFLNKAGLKQHYQRHSNVLQYQCDVCEISFKRRGDMIFHKRRKHASNCLFMCAICGSQFVSKNYIRKHVMRHRGTATYLCAYCGQGFNAIGSLRNHEHTHADVKPFKCDVCNASFRYYHYMLAHRKRHTQGRKPFGCEQCGKMFSFKTSLQRHMKVHLTNVQCMVCGKVLQNQLALEYHVKWHKRGCNFECRICNRQYLDMTILAEHLMTHTGLQPFTCKYCDKRFSTRRKVKYHEDRHNLQRPTFQCHYCGKTYLTKYRLMKHLTECEADQITFGRNFEVV